jgi:hypothetical protein
MALLNILLRIGKEPGPWFYEIILTIGAVPIVWAMHPWTVPAEKRTGRTFWLKRLRAAIGGTLLVAITMYHMVMGRLPFDFPLK